MTIDLQLPAAACGDHHTAAGAGLPPGFRFHPTDEELLLHYLGKRAAAAPCPAPVIAEVDIYKYNPWELPAMAVFGESDGEWYFFSPRDRKYPNGVRPNRAAGSGYWKATGTDKPISISETQQTVLLGVKKALVFYRGRPPKGTKTSWIMHEYRLANAAASSSSSYTSNMKQLASSSSSSSSSASMRLDEWVLCRIYKKKEANQQLQHYIDMMMDDDNDDEHNLQVQQQQQQQAQSHRMPRPPSISDYLLDYSDDLPPSTDQTPSLHLGFTAVNEGNNKRHKTMEEYYSISISTADMLHASSSTSNNKSTQINFSSIFEPQTPAAAGHQLMSSHNDDTSI
ncbi:Os01g0104200 [Oryza sativa Japonica Group]|uniref:NAC domain-containing protein n=4 Tax=Oryza sativa TaxID=4530 RepID=A0A8J8XZF2_ORYSJ|nr:hypothetical protein OsI_00036 [Oryza sativa Indica Group]EAZ10203.1 hypothetical protein OsJ_00034 [Oryza sativa Japonica Group]KAB8082507.1 hypothetical protein EE612_004409 [Oryza sativa]BAS69955.1 Os01g0104200 [Oryza sativa Japonica Group]